MVLFGVDHDSFCWTLINKQKKYTAKYRKEYVMETHSEIFKIKMIVFSRETIRMGSLQKDLPKMMY